MTEQGEQPRRVNREIPDKTLKSPGAALKWVERRRQESGKRVLPRPYGKVDFVGLEPEESFLINYSTRPKGLYDFIKFLQEMKSEGAIESFDFGQPIWSGGDLVAIFIKPGSGHPLEEIKKRVAKRESKSS